MKSGLATLNGTFVNPFPVSMGEGDKIQGPFATIDIRRSSRQSIIALTVNHTLLDRINR
jgi:hypothetical protein